MNVNIRPLDTGCRLSISERDLRLQAKFTGYISEVETMFLQFEDRRVGELIENPTGYEFTIYFYGDEDHSRMSIRLQKNDAKRVLDQIPNDASFLISLLRI